MFSGATVQSPRWKVTSGVTPPTAVSRASSWGQGIEVDCRQPGGQRDPGHRSGEQGPAAKAVRFALRQLFRRAVTAAIVEECDDGALGRGDLAIQQKAEEGDLQQIQRTGEQQHGAGAPQSDQRRHTVNQQESSEKDQNRPDQRTEVPPQQHTGQPGQLCLTWAALS
mgnify:CR=1 FL=1